MKVEKSERRGRGDGLGAGTNAESLALDREREEARVLKFRENKCPDFGRGLKIILDAYRVCSYSLFSIAIRFTHRRTLYVSLVYVRIACVRVGRASSVPAKAARLPGRESARARTAPGLQRLLQGHAEQVCQQSAVCQACARSELILLAGAASISRFRSLSNHLFLSSILTSIQPFAFSFFLYLSVCYYL